MRKLRGYARSSWSGRSGYKNMPDPKVQAAIDEIEAVLEKHDMAGICFVSSESHIHYLHHFTASWCVRAKPKDYPNEEAYKKSVSNTVGMLMGFIDAIKFTRDGLIKTVADVGKRVTISHITKEEEETGPNEKD
jgi:hypothetical protein